MGIIETRIVLAVSLDDLIQRLRNEIGPDAIARHEGQRGLKEVQTSKCWKFIQYQEQLAARLALLAFEGFSEPAANLVEDQAH